METVQHIHLDKRLFKAATAIQYANESEAQHPLVEILSEHQQVLQVLKTLEQQTHRLVECGSADVKVWWDTLDFLSHWNHQIYNRKEEEGLLETLEDCAQFPAAERENVKEVVDLYRKAEEAFFEMASALRDEDFTKLADAAMSYAKHTKKRIRLVEQRVLPWALFLFKEQDLERLQTCFDEIAHDAQLH